MDQPVILRSQRKWSLRLPVGLAAALLAGLGSYAYADFGAAQGGSGGGAAQTPWTSAIDAAGYTLSNVATITGKAGDDVNVTPASGMTMFLNSADETNYVKITDSAVVIPELFAIGGSTATYPAFRYGSSAGVVKLVRADGSSALMTLQGPGGANDLRISTSDGTGDVEVYSGAGVLLDAAAGSSDALSYDGTNVAVVGSSGLSVVGDDALNLKDVTSAPTVTAGYGGIYSLNSGGIQQVIVATGAGSGGFVGPWVSYTPVVSHSNVTASGYWRWSGPTTIECEVTLTYTGAPSGGLVIDTVPSTLLAAGWSMSTTVGRPSGYGHMRDSSVSYTTYPLEILLEDADSAAPYYRNAVSTVAAVTHTAPITIASGDDARFFFHVHVTR